MLLNGLFTGMGWDADVENGAVGCGSCVDVVSATGVDSSVSTVISFFGSTVTVSSVKGAVGLGAVVSFAIEVIGSVVVGSAMLGVVSSGFVSVVV